MTGILELAALGLFAGAYGSIIGAGGGFVIVPVLLLFFGFKVQAAVGTSLVAVFCTGLSAFAGYALQRRVDYLTVFRFSGGAILGAFAGSLAARLLDFESFSGLLGGLLAGLGLFVMARGPAEEPSAGKNKRRRGVARSLVDSRGLGFDYSVDFRVGSALCFGGGILAALFGIGGGVIIVPAMIFLQGIPYQIAVSTSAGMLAISSLTGVLSHSLQGEVVWRAALPLAAGTLAGAQAGAWFHRRLSRNWVVRLLSAALLVVGGRMLLAAIRGH